MSTFDTKKISLKHLLREITDGKIQLPDFQRGWVWDDDHIHDLLVSIARSFPIGAVMLLEAGGEVRFQTRSVEGLEGKVPRNQEPEKLILDGQQHLTTLSQALSLDRPVRTRTAKGKKIKRYYYFDIRGVVDGPDSLDDAVMAVDENRQLRSDFGRKVKLDLSTTELECRHLHFPCNQIMNSDRWETTLFEVTQHQFGIYLNFRSQVLEAFRSYQIPVIQLQKETSKEAVCLVFEKVNTGGGTPLGLRIDHRYLRGRRLQSAGRLVWLEGPRRRLPQRARRTGRTAQRDRSHRIPPRSQPPVYGRDPTGRPRKGQDREASASGQRQACRCPATATQRLEAVGRRAGGRVS